MRPGFLFCLFIFDLPLSLLGCFPCAELIYALNDKAREEIGGVGEQDRQNEERKHVDERSEDSDRVDYGKAHVLDEGNITLIKVVEVDLEGVREGCRDNYVDREKDGHYLNIVLRVDAIELQRYGEHKVEHDEVMEDHRVEARESVKEALYTVCRIYDLRHKKHIKEERREAYERHRIGNVAVLAVVESVKRQNVKE